MDLFQVIVIRILRRCPVLEPSFRQQFVYRHWQGIGDQLSLLWLRLTSLVAYGPAHPAVDGTV
jgi:hypothetical protein